MKSLFFSLLAAVSLACLLPATSSAQANSIDKTVVDIAAGNENFTTLVAAIKAADLAGTLSGEGPFTVFAPTDAAFAALPDGLVAALVRPENKEVLQKILTYHVIAAKLDASSVVKGIKENKGKLSAATVSGGKFSVMTNMGKVMIKDAQGNVANVTATDIMGSNGIIHVIDRVILPADVDPAALLSDKVMVMSERTKPTHSRAADLGPTISTIASGNDNFKTLTAALGAVGLVETFDSPGEYTVFAPTDAAFGALPDGTVNNLVANQKDVLKGILTYHVIPAKVSAASLVAAIKANKNYYLMQTLGGQTLVATIKGGDVQLIDAAGNRSTVVVTDVEASNGIIHGIDAVVMPK